MARPTLFQHRKFQRLTDDLGDAAKALGSLEFLWAHAYESGDELLGDARDVELIAKWRGERGALLGFLLGAGGSAGLGFIEERDGLFYVHDLWHHAPDYVRKRAEREAVRVENGCSLSEIRAEAGRKGGIRSAEARRRAAEAEALLAQQELQQNEANGNFATANGSKAQARARTPAPSPALALAEGTLFESSAPPPSASAAEPDDPVEIWVPFEGKEPPTKAKHGPWRAGTNGAHWEYGVTASLLAKLRSLYPGVEVENAARQFADWCYRNPAKRKTYSGAKCGVLESLHFWLGKRQNGGGGQGSAGPPFPTTPPGRHYAKL